MAAADATVWQTLVRIYGAVFACAICIPPLCAFPTLFGVQSFVASLVFGTVGVGAAGVLYVLVDAQIDEFTRVVFTRRNALTVAVMIFLLILGLSLSNRTLSLAAYLSLFSVWMIGFVLTVVDLLRLRRN